jgi:hypothetical protein
MKFLNLLGIKVAKHFSFFIEHGLINMIKPVIIFLSRHHMSELVGL